MHLSLQREFIEEAMQMVNQDDRFLTIREAARMLNFSRKHVYELVQGGKLRASKVWGNRWRVPIDAVQQLKQAREAVVSQ